MKKHQRQPVKNKPTAMPMGEYPVCQLFRAFDILVHLIGDEVGSDEMQRHWLRAISKFEDLPTNWDHCPSGHAYYFVLIAGEWHATNRGQEEYGIPGSNEHYQYLRYTLPEYDSNGKETGTFNNGLAPFGTWAYCSADDTPCIPAPPWFENWPHPEKVKETRDIDEDTETADE